MKRIKTTGLTVALALALTALLGAASASASQFRAEEYPTTASATQGGTHTITVPQAKAKCETATASGTMSEASSALTLTPAYQKCVFMGVSATVSANSCNYVFHSTNETVPYTGSVDIACAKEGEAIEVKTSLCTLKLPAQTSLGAVELADSSKHGSNRTITATLNVTGLKYTEVGTYCPESGTHENGAYAGSYVVKGVNEKTEHAVGVYVDNHVVESPPLFEAEKYAAVVNGVQGGMGFNFPTASGGQGGFNCNAFAGNGKMTAASGELIENLAKWSGCYFGGEFKVSRNGCSLAFHATTGEAFGSMGIACPEGAQITFTTPFLACKVSIPPQSGLNSFEIVNSGTGTARAMEAKISVSGIKYKTESGLCTHGTYEDGSMAGAWSLKGYVLSGEVEINDEGTHRIEYKTGEPQGIWVE